MLHQGVMAGRQTRLGGVGQCQFCSMMRVQTKMNGACSAAVQEVCMPAYLEEGVINQLVILVAVKEQAVGPLV